VLANESGIVNGIFLQDEMMRKMFEKFPEVLLIDATYKQIKLRLPDIFPWNRFLNRNSIPALSLSGNPNFSLLLPNPDNRSKCLVWLSKLIFKAWNVLNY